MADPSEKTEVLAAGDPRLQPRIGRYRLERRLGAGGMAEVFRARADGPMGFEKQVVIKRIRPQLAASKKFVEMFLREGRLLAMLDHPNIVRIVELDEENGEYFLALEYLEGLSLREVAERHWAVGRVLPIEALIRIMADASLGLEHAHNFRDMAGRPANIIHRDVSPDNLFVTTSGNIKVIDFGIAKREGMDSLTQAGELKGKVPFMSPEHLHGESLDARSDLFSVGVVLYWLLTGRRPFDGSSDLHTMKAILEDPATPPRVLNPKIPVLLEGIVLSLLEKDRNQRIQSAGALHDALSTLLVGLPRGAPQPAELAEAAMRLPHNEHEVIPPGLAAAPSVPWPDQPAADDLDDIAGQPTRARFVVPLGPIAGRDPGNVPHSSDPTAQTQKIAIPKLPPESDPQHPNTDVHEPPKTEVLHASDLPSEALTKAGRPGLVLDQVPSDPIIDVERVARVLQEDPQTAPSLPRISAGDPPPSVTSTESAGAGAPTSSADPAAIEAALTGATQGDDVHMEGPATLEQAPVRTLEEPDMPMGTGELERAMGVGGSRLPIVAGVGTVLIAALGVWWFGLRPKEHELHPVDGGLGAVLRPEFSDAGLADSGLVEVVDAVPSDAGTTPHAPTDAGSAALGAEDAGSGEQPPAAEDVGDAGPSVPDPGGGTRRPRGRLVALVAPPAIQWLGPNNEKLCTGTCPTRLDGARTLTAVDTRRGVKTRIPVDARSTRVDYGKVPRSQLVIHARPFADITIGREHIGVTPFDPIDVVPGTYDIKFVYKKSVHLEHVEVKAGKPATVNVIMK